MMSKTKLLLITSICLLAGSNTSLAGDRTEREMLSIAQAHFIGHSNARRQSSNVKVEKLMDEPAYCVYGGKTGFVVVSRDDSRMAVLGYSDSQFNADHMPCGMKWWLEAVAASATSPSQNLLNRVTYTVTAPLLSTQWNQGDPYNFMTPTVNGEHTLTGCVATAMAQIMKYYEYPAQGKGSGYYTLGSSTSRITESINGVYEWDKMLDDYTSITLTDELRQPIALLMKEAGLATAMNYDLSGSGAHSQYAAHGLAYNFEYDSLSIHSYMRSYFSDTEWMTIIYDELANGRPILYGGSDRNNGGHAFVFDGVDEDGRVHVNWGWGGSANGFFDIADLNPQTGSTLYHFNDEQDMIVGFRCSPEPTTDEQYQSLWGTSEDYTVSVNGKKLTFSSGGVYNYHFLTFYGTLGVAIESTDGHPENDQYVVMTSPTFGAQATFWGVGSLSGTKILYSTPSAGNYRVFFASKALQDEKPQPVRSIGGPVCYNMTVSNDGTMTISDSKEAYTTTAIHTVGQPSVTTAPTRYYDLRGREVDASYRGITIVKQGNVTRKVVR